MRDQTVALDKGIVPIHRDPSLAAAIRKYHGDSVGGDFFYAFQLFGGWAAVVGVAADHESLGAGGYAGLRCGVVSTDVGGDDIDTRQIMNITNVELGTKCVTPRRRSVKAD